jgi:hypothetical protein
MAAMPAPETTALLAAPVNGTGDVYDDGAAVPTGEETTGEVAFWYGTGLIDGTDEVVGHGVELEYETGAETEL